MTTQNFTETFAAKFKKSYSFKMGGDQTVVMPNGQEFYFNDKEYYSGLGAKYNSSIKHDNIGRVEVTKEQVKDRLKEQKDREIRIKKIKMERKAAEKRYAENKKAGIYGISEKEYGSFIELSEDEIDGKTFDAARLAKTLDISIQDASLLFSNGKTYVFAKQISTGRIIELYHASLSVNNLSISVSYPTAERVAEFNHNEWASAPYSQLVGMTTAPNHFVC